MARRTFLPTLVALLRRVCVYITRYRAQMIAVAPEGFETAINAVVAACEVVIDLVPHESGG